MKIHLNQGGSALKMKFKSQNSDKVAHYQVEISSKRKKTTGKDGSLLIRISHRYTLDVLSPMDALVMPTLFICTVCREVGRSDVRELFLVERERFHISHSRNSEEYLII